MENNSDADGRVGKRLRVFGTRKDFGTNEKIKNWKRSELNEILGKHKKQIWGRGDGERDLVGRGGEVAQ